MYKFKCKIFFIVVWLLILATTIQTFAQGFTVTGTLTDETGAALPGVTVVVKGTAQGTTTNADGRYSINVPDDDAVLVFAFLGYTTQEILVGNQRIIDVEMHEGASNIEELVVVGYGTLRRSDIAGAVTSVSAEDMQRRNPVNIEQGLQGAAAGVLVIRNSGDPSGDATVRIRGVATLSDGGGQPLYVVDGIQVGSNANFVNPNDIESIEVLKDASSTAIYGARGANGVILITTKRGDAGRTRLSASAYWGVSQFTGKLDILDAQQFADALQQARTNDGTLTAIHRTFNTDNAGRLKTIDWQDAMTQNAISQNYNISASGGNDRTQASLSLGYMKREGIVINTNFTRITVRASVSHRIKDFVEMGGSMTYVNTQSVSGGQTNIRSWALLIPTLDRVEDDDGLFYSYDYNQRRTEDNHLPHKNYAPDNYYAFYQTSQSTGVDFRRFMDNPYAQSMRSDKTPSFTNRTMASTYLDFNLFRGLKFRTIGSWSVTSYDNSSFNLANGRTTDTNISQVFNQFTMNQRHTNGLELENYFTYTYRNPLHNLVVTAGNNISRSFDRRLNIEARNFVSDTYRQIGLTSDTSTRTGDGRYDLETRFLSFFGRVAYTYKDRYTFVGTVRRDGSSNFGSGNRWGTFPSAAVAWRLSEEDFMRDISYINNLKLRLGWGQTGNSGGATSQAVPQLTSNRISYDYSALDGENRPGAFTKEVGFAQNILINENLHWETNTQTNIGLDIGMYRNSLNITLDYFIRDTEGILLNARMRPSTGFYQVYENAGQVRNSGLEITVSYNRRINDWRFGATFSGSTLKNEVIDVGDPIYYGVGEAGDLWNETSSITMNGHPIASFYGNRVVGLFDSDEQIQEYHQRARQATGDAGAYWHRNANLKRGDFIFADLNGNGYWDDEDKEILGNGFPNFNYGLNLSVSYKNFDFMIYTYGIAGVEIFSYSKAKLTNIKASAGGTQNLLVEKYNDAWTSNHTTGSTPALSVVDHNSNVRASSAYLEKGDFFKISNLQIGYTLPASTILPLKMESARIYFSIENLATITGYKYGDPEVGTRNVLQTGFDLGRYPAPRTFAWGINFSF